MTLGAYISIRSAVSAFVSATLWVIGARARVSYDPKPNEDGCYPSGVSDGDDDFMETVKKQGGVELPGSLMSCDCRRFTGHFDAAPGP